MALAFALDKITRSLSPPSCIEERKNSAERMLQKEIEVITKIAGWVLFHAI